MKHTTLFQIKKYGHFVILFFLMVSNHLFLSFKSPDSNKITSENSNLPSNHVNMIYIDSMDTKWIATDEGLARYAEDGWIVYADSGYFKSNVINDIDYELTSYGRELWFATDSGLTVSSYGVDGITGATTFYPGDAVGSSILDWKVENVVVDALHNRWATTASAISVFQGSTWDTTITGSDAEGSSFDIADVTITDAEAYDFKDLVLFSTKEKGILRYEHNDVDGISGASTYGQPWSSVDTEHFNAIDVKGEAQWYGSNIGSYFHPLFETKSSWFLHNADSGLVNNEVESILIDANDNIWMGTNSGLSVLKADGSWISYTEAEGLINNTVNHITSDMQSNIWVSTNGGIEWFTGVDDIINGISSDWNSTQTMSLFPNPVKDELNLRLNIKQTTNISIQIISVNGQLVYSDTRPYNLNKNRISINIREQSELKSGIYFLKVNTDEEVYTEKFIIDNN